MKGKQFMSTNTNTRILAVEDDRINQVVLNTLFKQLSVSAEMVSTGAQALSVLEQRHGDFSLVLMDLGLPDTDGTVVATKIRELEARLAASPLFICAVTGHNTPEKRAKCQSAGMDHFLPKPILLKDLASLLETVLNI
jgi:CheY-like chemotaxis protein